MWEALSLPRTSIQLCQGDRLAALGSNPSRSAVKWRARSLSGAAAAAAAAAVASSRPSLATTCCSFSCNTAATWAAAAVVPADAGGSYSVAKGPVGCRRCKTGMNDNAIGMGQTPRAQRVQPNMCMLTGRRGTKWAPFRWEWIVTSPRSGCCVAEFHSFTSVRARSWAVRSRERCKRSRKCEKMLQRNGTERNAA